MSNPNNLLRPPILNPDPPNNNAASPANQQRETIMSVELRNAIASIVTQTLRTEGVQIINSIINPNLNEFNGVDQVINREHRADLGDLDKIPDIVRSLREFSGNNIEFTSWKKSVERILQLYEPLQGTAKYYGIISVIRNKIIGQADKILESYNTPLNWNCIIRCLTTHYADKRDVTSLEYQMASLVQGKLTIEAFYQEVYTCLSLILNKLSSLEMSNEALNVLTKTYRDKALDTFVRGLNGDLPRLLAIKEPNDLPQALSLCQKLNNQTFRTNYAHNVNPNSRKQNNNPPELPPRFNTQRNRQMTFYPGLAYQPQANFSNTRNFSPFFNQRNFPHQIRPFQLNQQQPQRPLGPKPQPRPEPMDVDESIRTRNVNYINRPRPAHQFQGKRPMQPSFQMRAPEKMQRNFHIETEQYAADIAQNNDMYDETIQEYASNIREYQAKHSDQAEDCTDIHFLD